MPPVKIFSIVFTIERVNIHKKLGIETRVTYPYTLYQLPLKLISNSVHKQPCIDPSNFSTNLFGKYPKNLFSTYI